MPLNIASSLSLLIIRIIIINITTYHHHLEHCYLQSGSEGLQTSDVTTQPKYPQDSHYPENLIMMLKYMMKNIMTMTKIKEDPALTLTAHLDNIDVLMYLPVLFCASHPHTPHCSSCCSGWGWQHSNPGLIFIQFLITILILIWILIFIVILILVLINTNILIFLPP